MHRVLPAGKQLWSPHPTKSKKEQQALQSCGRGQLTALHTFVGTSRNNADLLLPSCMEPGEHLGVTWADAHGGCRTWWVGADGGWAWRWGDSQGPGRQGPKPRAPNLNTMPIRSQTCLLV